MVRKQIKSIEPVYYITDLMAYALIIITLTAANEKSWDVFISGIVSMLIVTMLFYGKTPQVS